MEQDTRFPGISAPLAAAALAVLAGGRVDPNVFHVRNESFYHRQLYADAGQAKLTYFQNVVPTAGVCNLPANGSLPTEMFGWLTGMRIDVFTGIASGGNRATNGTQSTPTTAVGFEPVRNADEIRTILNMGIVNLSIGGRKIVSDVMGVTKFASGGGFSVDMSISATNAAGSAIGGAFLNNGAPTWHPGWVIEPFPVFPQRQIVATIEWVSALALTNANQYVNIVPHLLVKTIQPANG